MEELPKLWYWFTWANDGAYEARIETFEDMIEAHAKHTERSRHALIITPVTEHFGAEIGCRDAGLRFWSSKGAFGRPKRDR